MPTGPLRVFLAVALWGISLLIVAASAASFAESYRGLWLWARHHTLSGFWAAVFPLQVDVFIAVGELTLFVAMAYRWDWRGRGGAWAVSLLGLAASIAGNIGHVTSPDVWARATAAVPPLAAFAALWVGLGILKRVVSRHRDGQGDEPARDAAGVVLPEIPTDNEVAALIALRATTWAGNALSGRQLETRFGLTRAQSTRVRQLVLSQANGHTSKRLDPEPAEPEGRGPE